MRQYGGWLLLLVVIVFGVGYWMGGRPCRGERVVTPEQQSTQTIDTTRQVEVKVSPTPQVSAEVPETEKVFDNYNPAAVGSGPTSPTVFTLSQARTIYMIQDYHWNGAKGKPAGTIGLKAGDGTVYGPWVPETAPGQGGVPNAYWTVYPKIELPAGTYTIVDSDPASWAQNSGTQGRGMSQVYAVK